MRTNKGFLVFCLFINIYTSCTRHDTLIAKDKVIRLPKPFVFILNDFLALQTTTIGETLWLIKQYANWTLISYINISIPPIKPFLNIIVNLFHTSMKKKHWSLWTGPLICIQVQLPQTTKHVMLFTKQTGKFSIFLMQKDFSPKKNIRKCYESA